MIVEEHRQGVTVSGPALVVRRAGILGSVRAAQQGAADPRNPLFDPANYRDRAEISPEGRALATQRDRVNPSPASASDPTSSADRPVPSPASSSSQRSEAPARETAASTTGAVSTATDAPARGDVGPAPQGNGSDPDRDGDRDASGQHGSTDEKGKDDEQAVAELKRQDAKVKAHEQAHLAAAGGQAVGGPTYEYEKGPDGNRYAVEGDVKIRFGGTTPGERLQQAERAARAALAPSEPSSQDRAVAAEARAEAMQARQELAQETTRPAENGATDPAKTDTPSTDSPTANGNDESAEAASSRDDAPHPDFSPLTADSFNDHDADDIGAPTPTTSPRIANAYRSHSALGTTASLEAAYTPGHQVSTFA